jgi:uncharacterized repeat protein (TIGR03803 family)
VFALNAATGSETVLHSFTGGSDGAFPAASVIYHHGTLYGTTEGGQEEGEGTVFAVDATTGAEAVLVDFNSANGSAPADGLLYNHGALYGTTTTGGQRSCCGVVFKVDPKTGIETVIYNFVSDNNNDGWDSTAGVINVDGMLYGTTFAGGIANCFNGYTCGTIFRVDPKTGAEKVLYEFTGKQDQGQPLAGLICENVNACENHLGCGTVFKFVP